jgi:hypothetical protein
MFSQLIMAVIVVAFYGGILDRAVHSLDLAICPWMVGFGQSMFNPVHLADHVEAHLSGIDGITVSALRTGCPSPLSYGPMAFQWLDPSEWCGFCKAQLPARAAKPPKPCAYPPFRRVG